MFDAVKGAMDSVRKIQLPRAMELEEVFQILETSLVGSEVGVPELKRGIMGRSIVFPEVSRVIPHLSVKGDVATLRKVTNESKSSIRVGKLSLTTTKDRRGKGLIDSVKAGSDYFKAVADAVEAALTNQ